MFPVIKERKIRIAIVGCGRISKNHFGAIEKYPDDLSLVAVCDNDPEALSVAERNYKVPGYTCLEEMLKEKKLDAVALCTPSGLHPDQTVLVARHGVHVISEKPMATRWSDGERMVKACDQANVRLLVVKQNRRNTTLQLLKRAVDERRFGKIHMVHLNVFWDAPPRVLRPSKMAWNLGARWWCVHESSESLCGSTRLVDWPSC